MVTSGRPRHRMPVAVARLWSLGYALQHRPASTTGTAFWNGSQAADALNCLFARPSLQWNGWSTRGPTRSRPWPLVAAQLERRRRAPSLPSHGQAAVQCSARAQNFASSVTFLTRCSLGSVVPAVRCPGLAWSRIPAPPRCNLLIFCPRPLASNSRRVARSEPGPSPELAAPLLRSSAVISSRAEHIACSSAGGDKLPIACRCSGSVEEPCGRVNTTTSRHPLPASQQSRASGGSAKANDGDDLCPHTPHCTVWSPTEKVVVRRASGRN